MSPKRLKLVAALGLILPGILLAAGALALNLQLEYPQIPGTNRTLNKLVEDQLVALDCAKEDCTLVPRKVSCKEVNGKLIAVKPETGEGGVAKVCKVVPAQFTIPDIFIFLFQAAIWIGVILAFFSLVFIGLRFATSSGDPIRLRGAKDRLRGIAFGVLVLIGSFLLLRLINPELTALRFVQKGACSGTEKCKGPVGFDLSEETQSVGSAGGLTLYSENSFAGNAVNVLVDIPETQKQLVGPGGLGYSNNGVLLRSLKLAPNCKVRLFDKKNYGENEKDDKSAFIEVANNGTVGTAFAVDKNGIVSGKNSAKARITIPLDRSGILLFSRIDDLEIGDGNYWGDDIDSIQFMTSELESMHCAKRRGVVFYESVETKNSVAQGVGRQEAFWNNEENFETTFIGNDRASFMTIVGNVSLTIYDNAKFEGSSRAYTTTGLPAYGVKDHDLTKETWKKSGTNDDEIINDQISSLKISFPASP